MTFALRKEEYEKRAQIWDDIFKKPFDLEFKEFVKDHESDAERNSATEKETAND